MAEAPNDVLVIGAGMAGLTAARALAEAGLKVLVVEAQDRIGGRILTHHISGEAIESGAEFIHGRPAELWALIDEIGLETYERGGAQLCFEDGTLTDCSGGSDSVFEPLEKLKDFDGPDLSFAEYLDRDQRPEEERERIIGFVEGFNAADHRVVSAAALGAQQEAEDANGSHRNYRLRGGYDQLPAYLARRIAEHGGRVQTGTPVREIRWHGGEVEVLFAGGKVSAPHCIVTLPLGVLQSGSVAMTPPPRGILDAAEGLRMGQVRRFTLLFEPGWRGWLQEQLPSQPELQSKLKEMSFLFAYSEMPPVWWTPHPEPSDTITGWVGGPRSAALAGMDAAELGRYGCTTLAKILGVTPGQLAARLRGCWTHDWQQDEFTQGAYSYVATGGLDASRRMSEPVEDTLFFAGEHTDITGHWGTVHAAMRSGVRAAKQVLDGRAMAKS